MVQTSAVVGKAHRSVSQSGDAHVTSVAPLIRLYGISMFNDVCEHYSNKYYIVMYIIQFCTILVPT